MTVVVVVAERVAIVTVVAVVVVEGISFVDQGRNFQQVSRTSQTIKI